MSMTMLIETYAREMTQDDCRRAHKYINGVSTVAFQCPECHAGIQAWCVDAGDKRIEGVHPSRRRLYFLALREALAELDKDHSWLERSFDVEIDERKRIE